MLQVHWFKAASSRSCTLLQLLCSQALCFSPSARRGHWLWVWPLADNGLINLSNSPWASRGDGHPLFGPVEIIAASHRRRILLRLSASSSSTLHAYFPRDPWITFSTTLAGEISWNRVSVNPPERERQPHQHNTEQIKPTARRWSQDTTFLPPPSSHLSSSRLCGTSREKDGSDEQLEQTLCFHSKPPRCCERFTATCQSCDSCDSAWQVQTEASHWSFQSRLNVGRWCSFCHLSRGVSFCTLSICSKRQPVMLPCVCNLFIAHRDLSCLLTVKTFKKQHPSSKDLLTYTNVLTLLWLFTFSFCHSAASRWLCSARQHIKGNSWQMFSLVTSVRIGVKTSTGWWSVSALWVSFSVCGCRRSDDLQPHSEDWTLFLLFCS